MKKYILMLSIVLTIPLSSCNSEGIGIFYKISVEPPLSTSELSEKRIYKIVSDGTDTYVLAGAAIYKENGSEWDQLTAPADPSDSTKILQAVSLATDGTTIFSVLASDTSSSVYELSGNTWSLSPNALVDSNDLYLIEGNGTFIFICEETSIGNYDLYSYETTPNTLVNITGTATITKPIISATYDGTADFYLISSNSTDFNGDAVIYVTSDPSAVDIDAVSVPGIATAIGSVKYDTTTLYAAGKDGFLYSSDESVGAGSLVWTKENSTALVNSFGNTAKLGQLEVVTIGTDYLIIGSDTGYFEMSLPAGTPGVPTAVTVRGDTVYEAIDLYQDHVFSILENPSSPGEFYIGSENGLWYSDNTGIDQK